MDRLGIHIEAKKTSNPRTGVRSQYNYLVSNGATEIETVDALQLLDLVYLNPTEKDAHVMIITGFDQNGNPLLSGNSNDRISLSLSEATNGYSTVKYLRVVMEDK